MSGDADPILLYFKSIGADFSHKLLEAYGEDAIALVNENPYRLILDIRGLSFKIVDELAKTLGVAQESPLRVVAGIANVLSQWCEHGHCAVRYADLIAKACKFLKVPAAVIEQAMLTVADPSPFITEIIEDECYVYPVTLHQAETDAAGHIKRLNTGVPPWGAMDLAFLEKHITIQLSDSQRSAIHTALDSKITIITGGPGVGKTTLVNSLLKIIRSKDINVVLCAPTGRAAKRLTEATSLQAKTIHRLLKFEPKTLGFKYTADNPLPIDVLIIDESSMIDILLFNYLLQAVPDHAAILFIGDVDQLPSVGPGAMLSELMHSEQIKTVRLTEIFRQAQSSKIIINANRVNQGHMPLPNELSSDFYTIYADTPDQIQQKLIQVVCTRLPAFYECDPVKDIQVLTPMNRGGLGARDLNAALQQQLNGHSEPKIIRLGTTFAPGDKVIQLNNNYEKDVFNGDIGYIDRIDVAQEKVMIYFDQSLKEYQAHELDELTLAYAISIHKSQGSEFPIVVMVLAMEHYMLLSRNVLYTGMTRGKKIVVLIGQKKAIKMAVENNKEAQRISNLRYRLQ